jgi:signal peptidase
VICIAAVFLLAVGILPHFGVYRTLTALSNSMHPTFSAGDVLVVRPEPLTKVRAGQVLALQLPNGGRVETHRVVRVSRAGAHPIVETAGDATKEPDPWGRIMLTGTTAWRVTLVVPKVGYVVHAFRTPLFHLLGLYVCPALLALLALLDVWDVPARLRRLRPGAVVLRPPHETVPTQ